jgi:hypothetical protein
LTGKAHDPLQSQIESANPEVGQLRVYAQRPMDERIERVARGCKMQAYLA